MESDGVKHTISFQNRGTCRIAAVFFAFNVVMLLSFEGLAQSADEGTGPGERTNQTDKTNLSPAYLETKTDWVKLQMGAGYLASETVSFSLDLSFFLLRWKHVYWEIIKGYTSMGDVVGAAGGTGVGVPWRFGISKRHELRTGVGLLAGQLYATKLDYYEPATEHDDSYRLKRMSKFFIVPEANYTFHVRRHFGVEVGVSAIISVLTQHDYVMTSDPAHVVEHKNLKPIITLHAGISF